MGHTERLRRSPNPFRRLPGITPAILDKLLADLIPRHEQADAKRKSRPDRQRRIGAGRKHALGLSDRLLMLLIYYRTCTTHVCLGFLFGLDDSAVGRTINPLRPLVAGIFRIPERKVGLQPDEIEESFFAATERPTRRPRRGQQGYCSGKKKRHALKARVVVAHGVPPPGEEPQPQRGRVRIAAVCVTRPGSLHDKRVYDRSRAVRPPGAKGTGDAAYIGTSLEAPPREPRGGQSTAGRKAEEKGDHGVGSWRSPGSARWRRGGWRRRGIAIQSHVARGSGRTWRACTT